MADKPYKVIVEGEDGRGTQIWEAETPEEMAGQFKQAQTNATNKIRQQEQELVQLRQLAMQSQNNNNGSRNHIVDVDERRNALLQNPDATIAETAVRAIEQRYGPMVGQLSQMTAQANAAREANEFVEKHPELKQLIGTSEGKKIEEALAEILNQRQWECTAETLEDALAIAQQHGKISGATMLPHPLDMRYVPSTVTRPSAQVNTSESEAEFLTHAPLKEVEKYIRKKHGGV